MKTIPLSRVFVNDEIREAALRAVNSGWYILSQECEAFEAEIAAYIGTKEAVLCSNWTTGALMLLHAMGVCPGDEILVPSHTAFPSIEPMIHRGARPVFIDIDETYCIDVDLWRNRCRPARSEFFRCIFMAIPRTWMEFFWLRRNTGFRWRKIAPT